MIEVSTPVSTDHITQNQSNPAKVETKRGKIVPIIMILLGILLAVLCTIIGVISGVPLICVTALAGVIPVVFGLLELIKLQRQKPEGITGRDPSEIEAPSTPSEEIVTDKQTPPPLTIPEFNSQTVQDFFSTHFHQDLPPLTTLRPAIITRCGDLTVTFAVQPIQFAIPELLGHHKSAVFNSVNVDVVPGRSGVNRILSKCVSEKCWNATRPVGIDPDGTSSYKQMSPGELTMAKWESSQDFKTAGNPPWNLFMQLRATPSGDYTPQEAFTVLVNLYLRAFSNAWDAQKNPAEVSCTYCQTALLGSGAYSPKFRDEASRESWLAMTELAFLTAVQKFSETRKNDGSKPGGHIVLADENNVPMAPYLSF